MNDYLQHHGVKGMHWGIRRYVDENGHLTSEGRKKRYGGVENVNVLKMKYRLKRFKTNNGSLNEAGKRRYSDGNKAYEEFSDFVKNYRSKQHGYDHKYDSLVPIGPKSKKVVDDIKAIKSGKSNWKASEPKRVRELNIALKTYMVDYGRRLTTAYIEDMGYNNEAATWITNSMAKENRSLVNS